MFETTAPFTYPALEPDIDSIRALFAKGDYQGELRNPHKENPVPDSVRRSARDSAVLLPIVAGESPALLVTKRHSAIRFAGHLCFPGGTADATDASPVATALRETEEEIGLHARDITVLGTLGTYFTQAGYRITPVVGLVQGSPVLRPSPSEVDEIYSLSLGAVLDARNYDLTWHGSGRGHIAYHEGDLRVAGPTVSVMVGLYEALLGWPV